MTEPKSLAGLLSNAAKDHPGPRVVPCARCSRLSEEYERHDRNWRPPEAASYHRDGRKYWLANCEACNWLEYETGWNRRAAEIGPPTEAGIPERERERRATIHQRLDREKEKYLQGRRARELAAKARASRLIPPRGRDCTRRVPGAR